MDYACVTWETVTYVTHMLHMSICLHAFIQKCLTYFFLTHLQHVLKNHT